MRRTFRRTHSPVSVPAPLLNVADDEGKDAGSEDSDAEPVAEEDS